MPLVILALIVLAGLYVFSTYNRFKKTEIRIKASIQEIGNQLKRQANLIPNLFNSVKGYLKHEQKIFSKITEARKSIIEAVKSGNAGKLIKAATMAQSALLPIKAVFESTPELKAAGPTQKLMDELRDTADKVMYSRRTLIDLVADYNIMTVTLPSSLIAGFFHFQQKPGLKTPEKGSHLEVSSTETKTPKINL